MASKKDGHAEDPLEDLQMEITDPDWITPGQTYTDEVEDLIRTYNLDQNKITVQVDENGRNHLVVDLGYLTAVDGSLLKKMEEDFQLQRKDIIERLSADDPEKVHREFLADQGDNENNLDLAVYWYRDCSVQFELHNYVGALDWIIPTEELKQIQLPLAEKIDSHRSDFPDRDMTLADLLTTWTPDGGSRESLLDQILEEIGKPDLVPVEAITMKKAKNLAFPTDPVTRNVFNQAPDQWGKKLSVKTSKDTNIIFSTIINPDFLKETGLTTSQPLDSEDWKLYLACASAIMAGNRKVTFNYLDKLMGGSGDLSEMAKEDMRDRLLRFRRTDFKADTSQEQAAGLKYDPYRYNDTFMMVSIIPGKMIANGGEAEGCIYFPEMDTYNVLPLIDLAMQRGQLTYFPANVFGTPGRRSKGKDALTLYLLTRIAAARNGSLSPDILWESVYTAVNIKNGDRKSEHNYRQYTEEILKFWSSDKCKIIEGFTYFTAGDPDGHGRTHTGPGVHLILLQEDQTLKSGKRRKQLKKGH